MDAMTDERWRTLSDWLDQHLVGISNPHASAAIMQRLAWLESSRDHEHAVGRNGCLHHYSGPRCKAFVNASMAPTT